MRSAPTTTQPLRPLFRKCPAMLSVISVAGMPSCCNSHTVRREPCSNGWASRALALFSKCTCEIVPVARRDAERNAHGRRHADGWRAANHHGENGFGDFFIRGAGNIDLFSGQAGLVDHPHTAAGPLDGL